MNRILLVVFVLLAGAGIWYFFIREPAYIDYPESGENIILFGDSLAEGVGAGSEDDLAAILQEQIGEQVINAGKAGDTTKTALQRLEQDILSRNPRIVIILVGGNDVLRRITPEETFSNIERMIDQIHDQGAGVLLLGFPGGIQHSTYENGLSQIAKEKQVSYIPNILKGIIGRVELMSDAVHPNSKGYKRMADRISPVLSEMLQSAE